jgi:hypothetical protein
VRGDVLPVAPDRALVHGRQLGGNGRPLSICDGELGGALSGVRTGLLAARHRESATGHG